MRRALLLGLCALWTCAASASPRQYGPDDAIGRLIIYADSLSAGRAIDDPFSALRWLLHDGDASAHALLESTIADPATPDGYRQWLLEVIPDCGGGDAAARHCAGVELLTRLLTPGRLSPEAWASCFMSLSRSAAAAPGCIGEEHLELVAAKLAEPEFLGGFSALRLLGAVAEDGRSAKLRSRAREHFWLGLDKLAAMSGDLAPTAKQVGDAFSAGLGSLPMKHPQEVDRVFLERVTESLYRSLDGREDCREATGLLLATLRERPDLRRQVNWGRLRNAFLGDIAVAARPEAQVIALSNLLPYAPQWIDAALVDELLRALVPKADSLRCANSRSHFGGTPEALAACANYGQSPRLTRRIEGRLRKVAGDAKQPERARQEALAALSAMAWQQPSLLDEEFKRALRSRLRHAELEASHFGPDGQVLALLQLSFELRPELVCRRDLYAIERLIELGGRPHVLGLETALVALARAASDGIYTELEALLERQQARVAWDPNESKRLRNLLARVRCERVGISPCD